MTKRQLFLVAGTLVLAACRGNWTGVCENAAPSAGAHSNRDEIGTVVCSDAPTQPAATPASN